MVRFALVGAGTIGRMHARNLMAHVDAELVAVYDINPDNAASVAAECGVSVVDNLDALLADTHVEAVLIASSTPTHSELIAAAATAGKHVLCEKPIDLDIARVDRCRDAIAGADVVVQIGFNRRFDPGHAAVRAAVAGGEMGALEQLVITSRDPRPQPIGYLEVSGGIFRDQMIHDFDIARFFLGDDEPIELTATGSVMVEPELQRLGDVDTAMVTLRSGSGTLVSIVNSRRSVFGYDQRIEAFCSIGMLISDNHRPTTVVRYGAGVTEARDPLVDFYIERYADSYRIEVDRFVDSVRNGAPSAVTFDDGRRALILADAATESLRTGDRIRLELD